MAAAIYRLADHRERTNLPLQLTSFVGRTAESRESRSWWLKSAW